MNRTTSSLVRIMMGGLFLLFVFGTANAQFKAGVQGTVTDTTGGLVPEAKITLTNTETGKTQETTTNAEGFYQISGLPPGKYTLTTEKSGYKKSLLESVTLGAENVQGLDILLETGDVTATVTVTAESSSQLETENANIRSTITTQEVRRIPQVGRNPYELVRTAPGVLGDTARSGRGNQAQFIPGTEQLVGGSNSGVFQTENQPQISANGQRVSSNSYLVDGVSVNSLGLGGAAVLTPNQESVKEVSVVTSSYSAEDGRNTGAQVKVVSQNGTNEFHGSAVFNYGSPKLNAFNKFFGSARAPRQPERVEQYERKFAGSLGGPIYLPRFGEGGPAYFSGKNKLFFFFSYEGINQTDTTFGERLVETPEFRDYVKRVRPNGLAAQLYSLSGIQPRIVASGLNPGRTIGQAVNGQLGLSFDLGSITKPAGQNVDSVVFDGIPDVSLVRLAFPRKTRGNQYNTRIDYNRAKDQFAISTYFTGQNSTDPSPHGRPFEDSLFKPFNAAATLAHIRTFSPTTLNEARFNFTRFHFNEFESLGTANLSVPLLTISDFNPGLGTGFNNTPLYGVERSKPNILTQNTFEFRDTLTHVRGNQVLKFGFETRREQDNNNRASEGRPEFVFQNLLSFANDSVFFENILVDPKTGGPVDGQRYFRTNSYGLFVQDDWKFRRNLTLNLGVRYEYQTPLTEKQGRLTNYVFGPNGVVDGTLVFVDRLYKPDRNNFAPRIGFAYSPTRFSDKAVLRGGFGISYDRLFSNLFTSNRFNPPFAAKPEPFFQNLGTLCCSGTNNAADPGPIIYTFAQGSPFSYPLNSRLQAGIDQRTGTVLSPTGPETLPGGFIRTSLPVEVNGVPENMPNSYVYNYSLEVQYQLPARIVASLGYVGSTGRKLIRTVDLNRYTPGDLFGYQRDAFNGASPVNRDRVQTRDRAGNFITPRLTGNPNFGAIIFPLPDVNSNYNAMILTVTRQYARGLQVEGTYRWSKSIDTSSFGRGPQQSDPSDQRLERGPSDFDVRHNLVVSGLWDIPLFRGRKDFLGKALGGFQINGIFTAHTGFPWTPQIGCCFPDRNDPNGDGRLPDRPTQYFGGVITNPSNQDFINGIFPIDTAHPRGGPDYFNAFNACQNFPADCFTTVPGPAGIGRNSFRGPSFRQLDLSIVKQTGLPNFLHLGEAANLEIRANFFNVLNLLNLPAFQPVTSRTDIFNGDFGRATFGLAGRVTELQARFSF